MTHEITKNFKPGDKVKFNDDDSLREDIMTVVGYDGGGWCDVIYPDGSKDGHPDRIMELVTQPFKLDEDLFTL